MNEIDDGIWSIGLRNSDEIVIPTLDEFESQVPADRLTKVAEDDTTIFKLRWSRRAIGTYQAAGGGSGGGMGFKLYCTVEIIKSSTGEILISKEFVGGNPPPRVTVVGRQQRILGRTGSLPSKSEIKGYLRSFLRPTDSG